MNVNTRRGRRRPLCGIESLETRSLLAGVPFQFTLDDPQGDFAPFPELQGALVAAGKLLTRRLEGDGSLEVRVVPNNTIPFARATATTFSTVSMQGIKHRVENSTITEARTGEDPNGDEPDILLELNTETFLPEVFFDPSGAARTAPLPADQEDFISAALHELVHTLGFQGYRTISGAGYGGLNVEFPEGFFLASTFDDLTEFGFSTGFDAPLFFNGQNAMSVYGNRVPLTSLGRNDASGENFYNLGNSEGSQGDDLLADLMNGIVFRPGERYELSELDLAILADLGWTIREPSDSWTNPDEPNDVNGDGEVSIADLLAVVTELRLHGVMHELPEPPDPPPYIDVNADGAASITDLLAVVQFLRAQFSSGFSGEGEAALDALFAGPGVL